MITKHKNGAGSDGVVRWIPHHSCLSCTRYEAFLRDSESPAGPMRGTASRTARVPKITKEAASLGPPGPEGVGRRRVRIT